MNRLLRYASILFAAAFFAAASAQTPSPTPSAAPPNASAAPRTPQQPKNLKVLPPGTDLRAIMHQYESDLRVHCSFCHAAADPATHRTDFASDANPTKETARYMIQMTADLNGKYLDPMPNRNYADPITCGTCHRGHHNPSVFVAPPEAEGNRPPAPQQPAGASPAPPTGSSR